MMKEFFNNKYIVKIRHIIVLNYEDIIFFVSNLSLKLKLDMFKKFETRNPIRSGKKPDPVKNSVRFVPARGP